MRMHKLRHFNPELTGMFLSFILTIIIFFPTRKKAKRKLKVATLQVYDTIGWENTTFFYQKPCDLV